MVLRRMFRSFHPALLFFFLAAALFFMSAIISNESVSPIFPEPNYSTDSDSADTQRRLLLVRQCLHDYMVTKHPAWPVLHLFINSCSLKYFPESFDFLKFHTDKLFLKLKRPPPNSRVFPQEVGYADDANEARAQDRQSKGELQAGKLRVAANFADNKKSRAPCVVVTLGIGNDTVMERDLHWFYPDCEFFGADPTPAVSQGYLAYGKYFPIAVDAPEKMVAQPDNEIAKKAQRLSIMGADGKYGRAVTEGDKPSFRTKGLTEFLSEDVQRPLVHFMSMDVEGSEYRLLPLLADQGAARTAAKLTAEKSSEPLIQTSNGPTICQMTIELHGPLGDYGLSFKDFETIFLDFVTRSQFVPLKAFSPGNHHRFFAFNAAEAACVEAFSFAPKPEKLRLDKSLMAHDKLPPAPTGTKFPPQEPK